MEALIIVAVFLNNPLLQLYSWVSSVTPFAIRKLKMGNRILYSRIQGGQVSL